ncbi:MAG TPA: hypothetical protein VNF29_15145 [Candidatus Binataceae bacterium]|nr:hypothetical protein [Candidatus Binataceae bacterium]
MRALVNREEVREENRRVLWAIIGVIVFLVMVSVVTILVKH